MTIYLLCSLDRSNIVSGLLDLYRARLSILRTFSLPGKREDPQLQHGRFPPSDAPHDEPAIPRRPHDLLRLVYRLRNAVKLHA